MLDQIRVKLLNLRILRAHSPHTLFRGPLFSLRPLTQTPGGKPNLRYITAGMSAKPPPSDLPIRAFSSAQELETFLEQEHTRLPGFYLKFAKKASGIPSVSAAEAVELALCFGWIDGRANAFDKDYWLVRYTPRQAKSIWSQKNVGTVERLIADGQMRPAGLAAVDAAKADGRWDRAYAGPASMTVPDDLTTALEADLAAREFFEGLSRADRYSVLHRLHIGAPGRRAERIRALVGSLAKGESKSSRVEGKGKGDAEKKGKKGKIEKTTVAKVAKPKPKPKPAKADDSAAAGSTRQLRPRKGRS